MRCVRCEFENMPGTTTCFSCGSILGNNQVAVDIHPPRAQKWRQASRRILWRIRTSRLKERSAARIRKDRIRSNKRVPFSDVGFLFLSVIPGLAHLVQRQGRSIRWCFAAWIVLLMAGIFFLWTAGGVLFIGLAVGVHAWIMADAAQLIVPDQKFWHRVAGLFCAGLCILGMYRATGSFLARDIVADFTSLTIPYQDIQSGDLLLCRRSLAQGAFLPRGSIVLVDATTIRVGYRGAARRSGGRNVIGQVIGFPHENVQIQNGVFRINERILDSEKFPVPQWLKAEAFSTVLNEDHYFVSMAYRVQLQNRKLTTAMIEDICNVSRSGFGGRAFMRWLPVSRRSWLQEIE
jgi:hypothetical protein